MTTNDVMANLNASNMAPNDMNANVTVNKVLYFNSVATSERQMNMHNPNVEVAVGAMPGLMNPSSITFNGRLKSGYDPNAGILCCSKQHTDHISSKYCQTQRSP